MTNGPNMTIILGIIAIGIIMIFGIISVYAGANTSQNLNNKDNSVLTNNTNYNSSTNSNGQIQTATLSFKNYEYVLTPNTLKRGVPVRITVDTDTVVGCMRNIVIKDFGVRKSVSPGNNIIEFTPNKDGTFLIACAMNMGQGLFSVNSNGITNSETEAAIQTAKTTFPKSTGGCTMSGCGGCGQ